MKHPSIHDYVKSLSPFFLDKIIILSSPYLFFSLSEQSQIYYCACIVLTSVPIILGLWVYNIEFIADWEGLGMYSFLFFLMSPFIPKHFAQTKY